MTQPTDFPREDLGETKQFKISSGIIAIPGEIAPPFYAGRHSYIAAADSAPGDRERRTTFRCLLCLSWGVFDTEAHVCSKEKAAAPEG